MIAERNPVASLARFSRTVADCEAPFDLRGFPVRVARCTTFSPPTKRVQRRGGGSRPQKGGELLHLPPKTVACGESKRLAVYREGATFMRENAQKSMWGVGPQATIAVAEDVAHVSESAQLRAGVRV